ncbi:MAG: helix-turn-helix domain-containing protein [Peptostreptococcus sp.]|jgi:transcriptional regulator, araC family|uniref:helix-turn-helix domain-containing protein n=1 Tax=Peptostreptococcus sp. TaxID=1262 RepID=UPI001CAAC711|nr:AraC family transcriptional regulator [Peptostreptococcus sp.]MBF1044796.1 helix-turn-helix domain-containing protein [Peptostreptococcus sp.]
MAYEFENFLVEMGFEKLHKSSRYSDLGVTYRIKSDEMDGYYWFYDTDLFSVNIHDFLVKKDLVVCHKMSSDSEVEATSSFVKAAHGECLTPYMSVNDSMVFVSFRENYTFRFILHGGFPYFSVGVEFKKKFINDYVTENFNISPNKLRKALQNSNNSPIARDIGKLVDEILEYRSTSPGSEMFYEIKVKEWLRLTLNYYFEENKKIKLNQVDDDALKNVASYISDHYASQISQDLLCEIALMGKTKLKESFKSKYNMTITEYIQRKRINVAEHMLLNTGLSISEVSRSVGYKSQSRFTQLYKKYTGTYPRQIKKCRKV